MRQDSIDQTKQELLNENLAQEEFGWIKIWVLYHVFDQLDT